MIRESLSEKLMFKADWNGRTESEPSKVFGIRTFRVEGTTVKVIKEARD